MTPLAGPFHIVAGTLAVAGAAKVWDPAGTAAALRAAGLPSRRPLVRALGLVEMVVALGAITFGGALPAAAVGAAYLAFTGFVLTRLRSPQGSGCGCFGASAAPLTRLHVVVNATAVALAVAVMVEPVPRLSEVLADQPWAGGPYLGLVALGVALAVAVLTVLPEARAARRPSVALADFSIRPRL